MDVNLDSQQNINQENWSFWNVDVKEIAKDTLDWL